MARTLRTPEEFRTLAAEIIEIAGFLKDIAKLTEKEGMEGLLVHGDSIFNNYIPKTWEWANGMKSEFESQSRAFRAGTMSKAERDQKRNQVSIPPPPAAKKPTKKRPK